MKYIQIKCKIHQKRKHYNTHSLRAPFFFLRAYGGFFDLWLPDLADYIVEHQQEDAGPEEIQTAPPASVEAVRLALATHVEATHTTPGPAAT